MRITFNGFRCHDNLELNISHSLLQENIPSATFPTKSFLSNPRTKKSLLFGIGVAKDKKDFFPLLEVWEPSITITPKMQISPVSASILFLHHSETYYPNAIKIGL